MNAKKILTQAILKLHKSKIKNPHLEAEILLSFILDKPREFIIAHPEYKLNKRQVTNYKLQVTKLSKGEPIAYLTGHKEFYDLDFIVNKDVLIPRPETELIVEETIDLISHISHPISLIDVGTGSGCIIISIFKQLVRYKLQATSYKLLATDISKKALIVAKRNAKKHGVNKKIKFLHGNLLDPILKNPKLLKNLNHPNNPIIITANLPYLTPNQIKNSLSIKHEPKLALSAGKDGLKYYRQLFKQIKKLNKLCVVRYALCEIDPAQKNKISNLIKKELFTYRSFGEGGPNSTFQIKKDLRGHSRLVTIIF